MVKLKTSPPWKEAILNFQFSILNFQFSMTEHFTISELIYSQTAVVRRIWNGAPAEAEAALQTLCETILEPLRQRYGRPINISSGYRCPELNRAVGGAASSQHLKGEAADLDTGSRLQNQHLARLIVELGLPFDQLIDENGYAWVHVSCNTKGKPRRQILRLKGGKYSTLTPDQL